MRRSALILVVLILATAAFALPPSPPTHVLDQTDLLTPQAERVFAASLSSFEQRTDIQMVVAILSEIEGSVEEDATRIYELWGLGSEKLDRGVLLVIWPTAGQSRIEVGYGLEGDLPDITAGRILRSMQDIPRSEPDHRIAYMLMQIAENVAPGDPLAEGQFTDAVRYERPEKSSGGGLGSLLMFIIIFVVMSSGGRAGRSRWLGPLLIASAMSGGRRGGGGGFGGGGFGGFSGGGGMSGGGGASGGW